MLNSAGGLKFVKFVKMSIAGFGDLNPKFKFVWAIEIFVDNFNFNLSCVEHKKVLSPRDQTGCFRVEDHYNVINNSELTFTYILLIKG